MTGRLGWRDGMVSLDGESLADAAAAVSRQTGIEFEFEDSALSEKRVGGYLAANDVPAFLTLLRSELNIEAQQMGARRYRLKRA